MTSGTSSVLFCACYGAKRVPKAAVATALDVLSSGETEFLAAADLCELAATRSPVLAELAKRSELQIAACAPRAVAALFAFADAPLAAGKARALDITSCAAQETQAALANPGEQWESLPAMPSSAAPAARYIRPRTPRRLVALHEPRGQAFDSARRRELCQALIEEGFHVFRAVNGTAQELLDRLRPVRLLVKSGGSVEGKKSGVLAVQGRPIEDILAALREAAGDGGPQEPWLAWYPAMDLSRCVDCGQCLQFCLFGVFAADEAGRVRVVAPDHCKPNCPACARVCPEGAILFPKYPSGPINGAEAEEAAGEAARVDLASLIQGDVHRLLRERSERARKRFSLDRSRAEAERERCRCMQESLGNAPLPDPAALKAAIQRRLDQLHPRPDAPKQPPTQ